MPLASRRHSSGRHVRQQLASFPCALPRHRAPPPASPHDPATLRLRDARPGPAERARARGGGGHLAASGRRRPAAGAGWGATLGYPAIVLDEHGPGVHGFVLESDRLGEHWARLDDFEGDGYDRVVTTADLDDGGRVEAYICVLRGLSSAAEVARS